MIKTLRRLVCAHLCKPEEEPHPFTTLRHRSGQHIRLVLQAQFPGARLRIADRDYSAPTLGEFEVWLKNDTGDLKTYRAEHYDCDNFAHELRCNMFKVGHALKTTLAVAYVEGYSPGGYHAFNIVVTSDDAVYIIEPQSDHVSLAGDSLYTPDFIQL